MTKMLPQQTINANSPWEKVSEVPCVVYNKVGWSRLWIGATAPQGLQEGDIFRRGQRYGNSGSGNTYVRPIKGDLVIVVTEVD